MHERSATSHEAMAAGWDARGNPVWAAFQRRCASLERESAALEIQRSDLDRSRAGLLRGDDQAALSDFER
ncbi:MAG: hypothetical protein ACYCXW_18155, partial [Solirubrobacteraceae bacterium]